MTSSHTLVLRDSRALIRRRSIFILAGRGLRCKRRTHELRMKIARFHRLTLAFSRKLASSQPLLRCSSGLLFLPDSSLSPHDAAMAADY